MHRGVLIERLERRTLASIAASMDSVSLPISEPSGESGAFLYPSAEIVTPPTILTYDLPKSGASSWEFSIRFFGPNGVDAATIGDGAIIARGESVSGESLQVQYLSTEPGEKPVAHFRIDAPGGTWDFADNGNYSLEIVAGTVASLNGHAGPTISFAGFNFFAAEHGADLITSLASWKRPLTSLEDGHYGTVPVTLKNNGDRAYDKDASVDVYLRSNDPNAKLVNIGSAEVKRLALSPGQSKVINVRVQAPYTLDDGEYHFQSDGRLRQLIEPNDSNNADRDGPFVTVRQGIARPPTILNVSLASPPRTGLGRKVAATLTIEHVSGRAGRYKGFAYINSKYPTHFQGKINVGQTQTLEVTVKVPRFVTDIDTDGNTALSTIVEAFTLPVETNSRTYSAHTTISVV